MGYYNLFTYKEIISWTKQVNIWKVFWKPVCNDHPLMVFICDLNSVVYKIVSADYLFWIDCIKSASKMGIYRK